MGYLPAKDIRLWLLDNGGYPKVEDGEFLYLYG
jgi:hypothetical protein